LKTKIKNLVSFEILKGVDHIGMIFRRWLPHGQNIIKLLKQKKIDLSLTPKIMTQKFKKRFSYAIYGGSKSFVQLT